MLEVLRSIDWARPPSPGVIATGVAVLGILGSIIGLNLRVEWLAKKAAAPHPTDDSKKKPQRSRSLFPKSDGLVLSTEKDDQVPQGPTPCATDSYVGFRPSSYDETAGVYVEWTYNGDTPVSEKNFAPEGFDYNGWIPQPLGFPLETDVDEYGSSFKQASFGNAVSAPISMRRGPMRSSFSDARAHGHSLGSNANFVGTPYAGSGSFKSSYPVANSQQFTFTDSMTSSPEMSPSFYNGGLSPLCDGSTAAAFDPPVGYARDRIASFAVDAADAGSEVYPSQVVELNMVEPLPTASSNGHSRESSKEWYSDDLASYENTEFNLSVLAVDEHAHEFSESFMPTPEVDSGEYKYALTATVSYDQISATNTNEGPCSPTSLSPQLASPSTLSSRSSNDELFQCPFCDTAFRVKGYLTRHLKKHAENKAYTCPFYDPSSDKPCHANGGFSRRDTYKAHLKSRHFIYPKKTPCSQRSMVAGNCRECGDKFESNEIWAEHHVRTKQCSAIKALAASSEA